MAKKWSGLFNEVYKRQEPTSGEGSPADKMARDRYLWALRSPAPTQWASPHLAESTRLRGAIYVAIKVLGDQAASAEAKVSKWHPDARASDEKSAKKALPRTHPLCEFLAQPNPRESGGYLRRRMVQQLSLTGTSLLWQVKNGLGKPKEAWCVPTGTYQPVPPCSPYPDGAYRIMPFWPGPLSMMPGAWSQGGVVVGARNIVATRHPHPLIPQEGLSPQSACSLELDTLESINQARLSATQRGISPSAVAEADAQALFPQGDELTRLRLELEQLLAGPDKAGRIALLSPGLKLSEWGASKGIEVGWIESWTQLVEFVLSVFGVTKSLAFMSEDSTFATLHAQLKQFNTGTMQPLLDMLAESINIQLIWPYWGKEYFLELTPRKVDDPEQEDKRVARAQVSGSITHNEARVALGWEPTEEEWGSERCIAGAKFAPEMQPQQQGAPGAPGEPGAGGEGGGEENPLAALMGDVQSLGGGEQPQRSDPSAEADRPRNAAGEGSGPPRKLVKQKSWASDWRRNGVHA
jgi:phage portal protein BeeE